jgi:hypothetical protein
MGLPAGYLFSGERDRANDDLEARLIGEVGTEKSRVVNTS